MIDNLETESLKFRQKNNDENQRFRIENLQRLIAAEEHKFREYI